MHCVIGLSALVLCNLSTYGYFVHLVIECLAHLRVVPRLFLPFLNSVILTFLPTVHGLLAYSWGALAPAHLHATCRQMKTMTVLLIYLRTLSIVLRIVLQPRRYRRRMGMLLQVNACRTILVLSDLLKLA